MILRHGGQLQWIGYAGGKPRGEHFVEDVLQGTRKASPNEPKWESGHVSECLVRVPRPSPRPLSVDRLQCFSKPLPRFHDYTHCYGSQYFRVASFDTPSRDVCGWSHMVEHALRMRGVVWHLHDG